MSGVSGANTTIFYPCVVGVKSKFCGFVLFVLGWASFLVGGVGCVISALSSSRDVSVYTGVVLVAVVSLPFILGRFSLVVVMGLISLYGRFSCKGQE